jgi:hypothetical protein
MPKIEFEGQPSPAYLFITEFSDGALLLEVRDGPNWSRVKLSAEDRARLAKMLTGSGNA